MATMLRNTPFFTFGSRLSRNFRQLASRHRHASSIGSLLLLLMFIRAHIYGGFFNAGLGIIMLSYLVLAGHTYINAMNRLKLLISTCVPLAAIALFSYSGEIAWLEGSIVLSGTMTGGYIAARISRQISQVYTRSFVTVAGASIALYFFYYIYAV
jgi:uncharacterized membrane protein YfcA